MWSRWSIAGSAYLSKSTRLLNTRILYWPHFKLHWSDLWNFKHIISSFSYYIRSYWCWIFISDRVYTLHKASLPVFVFTRRSVDSFSWSILDNFNWHEYQRWSVGYYMKVDNAKWIFMWQYCLLPMKYLLFRFKL